MNRWLKAGLSVVAIVVLAVAAFAAWISYVFTHDDIQQSAGPVSRDEAAGKVGIPLPPHAHAVQYASLSSGLQIGEFYVRFEAPVADCEVTAQAVFAKYARDFPQAFVPSFREGGHFAAPRSTRLRTDWFDPEKIDRGRVAGKGVGWEPRIWIDDERGIFYYRVTD